MTNNHRSATVSPSSENSPSQDMQSEEGSYPHPGGGGFNQYSSQDSLPDSANNRMLYLTFDHALYVKRLKYSECHEIRMQLLNTLI